MWCAQRRIGSRGCWSYFLSLPAIEALHAAGNVLHVWGCVNFSAGEPRNLVEDGYTGTNNSSKQEKQFNIWWTGAHLLEVTLTLLRKQSDPKRRFRSVRAWHYPTLPMSTHEDFLLFLTKKNAYRILRHLKIVRHSISMAKR